MAEKHYEDDRWDLERPVEHDDFNEYNDVAIFEGPVLTMYKTVSAREVNALINGGEDIAVLDVRPRAEYEKEHICGSINIPVEAIEMEAPQALSEDVFTVILCGGPESAESAVGADKLATLGFKRILRFTGGVREWREDGYCLEGLRKAA